MIDSLIEYFFVGQRRRFDHQSSKCPRFVFWVRDIANFFLVESCGNNRRACPHCRRMSRLIDRRVG